MIGWRHVAASLAFGVAALGAAACSNSSYCSVTFRGGCVPGMADSPAAMPAASPAAAMPAAIPAAGSPTAVPLGNPSDFADVDDKQCRSYGLAFGSRDYADCRIRLSAQHRGLDPGIGTAPNR